MEGNQTMCRVVRLLLVLIAILVVRSDDVALAQAPAAPASPPEPRLENPIEEHLFPPEFILQQGEKIRLSEKQREAIETDVKTLQEQLPAQEASLRNEASILGSLIPQSTTDEAQLLAQLDKVLEQERQIKRLQLGTMFRIRKRLTPEQLTRLQDIKKEVSKSQQQLQQRLQSKLMRVHELVEQRVKAGQPPHDVAEQMQAFPKLMEQGKVSEAEALLDDSLRKLEPPTPR